MSNLLCSRSRLCALLWAAALAGTALPAAAQAGATPATPLPNIEGGAHGKGVLAAVARVTAQPVTLDDAVRIALAGNPELLLAYRTLGVKPGDLVRSGLFSSAGQPLNVRRDFLGLDLASGDRPMPLPDQLRVKVAETAMRVAKETGEAYLTLAALEQSMGAMEQLLEAETAAAELTRSQQRAGTASARKTLPYEAQLAEVTLERDLQQAQIDAARLRLARLLGLPADRFQLRTAGVPEIPEQLPAWPGLDAFAWNNRADARQAEYDVRLDNPGALALAGAEYDNAIPLLAPRKVFLSENPIPASEVRLLEARRRVAAEVGSAEGRLRVAHAKAAGYRSTLLPVKAAIVEEVLKHYNGMLVGIYELLEAKSDELHARKAALEAARDFWIAYLELEHAVGGALPAPVAAAYAAPASREMVKTGHGGETAGSHK